MSIESDARAEADRRFPESDDQSFYQADGFEQGAVWAASRPQEIKRIEASPPDGWFVFGTHVDVPVQLEFYGEQFTEDLMPMWERPRPQEVPDDERDALIDDLSATVNWLKRTRNFIDADRVMRAIAALRRGPQEVSGQELANGLAVAMLGTEDGDLIDSESPVPAGEMYRLALDFMNARLARRGPQEVPDDAPERKPCEAFAWIGQPFSSCDLCGRPYWEHTHEYGVGPRAGELVPIEPERAARVKRKWGR